LKEKVLTRDERKKSFKRVVVVFVVAVVEKSI
jgi:hypothetical protein